MANKPHDTHCFLFCVVRSYFMSAESSYYQGQPKEVEKGKDGNGDYTLYERSYEDPCSCHPETCCHFDEKVWRTERYKVYKDGKRVYV